MIDNHCSSNHTEKSLSSLVPFVVLMKVEDQVELMKLMRNNDVFRQKELERAYAMLDDAMKRYR